MAAGAQERLTQRSINEYAAALERARFALVEETRLRLSGEPLSAYLRRIAQPLPGEPTIAYRARITSYIRSLSLCAEATTPLHHMPLLWDNGERNRQSWQRAVRSMSLLPVRTRKLRAAWHSFAVKNAQAQRSLDAELAQTLDIVLAAFAALRDATP